MKAWGTLARWVKAVGGGAGAVLSVLSVVIEPALLLLSFIPSGIGRYVGILAREPKPKTPRELADEARREQTARANSAGSTE